MSRIKTSAPGKLMLLGEHAVLYGYPCIVTAVDHRMEAIVETSSSPLFSLRAIDVGLANYQKDIHKLGLGQTPKPAKFAEFTVKNLLQKYPQSQGLSITTQSGFSSSFGFGSSSAVTVAIAKAFSELFGLNISNQELFEICYQTVLEVQGKGSGFDLAAAIWGGTILFQNKGELIQPLNIPDYSLAVGWTGIKYPTVQVIEEVQALTNQFPEVIDAAYSFMGYLVDRVVELVSPRDTLTLEATEDLILQKIGKYMDFCQGQLETIGVSSLELDTIIKSARQAGAFGAKLSGSGKGDCAIALVNQSTKDTVEKAIHQSGFEIIKIQVGAKGVLVV